MPYFVMSHPTVPGFAFDPPFDSRRWDVLPTAARQLDRKPLGDVILETGDLSLASERFKNAVEALEPGIHMFRPIEITIKTGEPIGERFYVFRCRQTFATVLSRQSGFDGNWMKDYFGRPYRGLNATATDHIVLSAPEIEGRHLFANLFHGPSALVFSDDLMERLQSLDLRYLCTYPVEAIDAAWNADREIGPWLDWIGDKMDWLRENQPATAEDVIALYQRYNARRAN